VCIRVQPLVGQFSSQDQVIREVDFSFVSNDIPIS